MGYSRTTIYLPIRSTVLSSFPPFYVTYIQTSHVMRLVLFILRKTQLSNAHAQPSSGAKCLIFGRALRLLPYFMCANSEGSGETARMHRFAWAFAGRLCDKYHNQIYLAKAILISSVGLPNVARIIKINLWSLKNQLPSIFGLMLSQRTNSVNSTI